MYSQRLNRPLLNGRPKSRLLETYEFLSPAIAQRQARYVRWLAGMLDLNVSVGILPGFASHVVITCSETDTNQVRHDILPLLTNGIRKQVHPMMREAFIELHDQVGGVQFEWPQFKDAI